MGQFTGNHRFSYEIWNFPVIFPLDQSFLPWHFPAIGCFLVPFQDTWDQLWLGQVDSRGIEFLSLDGWIFMEDAGWKMDQCMVHS